MLKRDTVSAVEQRGSVVRNGSVQTVSAQVGMPRPETWSQSSKQQT